MKITKYFLSFAAAVGMISGCYNPELIEITAPENVVAPVLEEVGDVRITKENLETDSLAFRWSPADFDAPTQIDYSIEIAVAGSSTKTVLTSGVTKNETVLAYKDINTVLLSDLKLPSGKEADLEFYVAAKIGEYPKVYSNAAASKTIPLDVVIPESDRHKHVWVIGDYCGWKHDKTQFLYDYTNNENTYSGVIDFGAKAKNGFKLTGAADWENGNWGTLDGAVLEKEQPEVQLRNDGGSGNITCYSKRFYNFEFDKSTLVLKVKNSFDQLGVIGSFNGWNGDVVMEYNPVLVRFYADVELAEDGELKVRADEAWSTSWGADMGSGNLKVSKGNYRIYLDLNNGSLLADSKMYGKPEPGVSAGEEEPEVKPIAWVLNGNFNDWGKGEPVVAMQDKGSDIWLAKKVKLAAIDEFKLTETSTNTWVGGPEANAQSTINPGDPYEVYKPELGVAFDAGDKNIAVGAEGEYDITYDAANNKITVAIASTAIEGWGVIGGMTFWESDIAMTKEGAVWSVKGVELKANDGWKIRKDSSWDVNRGASGDVEPFVVTVGEAHAVVHNGKNFAVSADGVYDIYYHEGNEEVHVLAAGADAPEFGNTWYLVGEFNSWTVADEKYMLKKDGEYFVFKKLVLEADGKVKFNAGDWSVNRGGDVFGVNASLDVTHNGKDLTVTAGTYDVYLSLDETKAYFMTEGKTPADAGEAPEPVKPEVPEELHIIGVDFGNWDWASPEVVTMNPVGSDEGVGQFWAIHYITANQGFKFSPVKDWGKDFHSLTTNDGYTESGGNCTVAENGLYMIHVDMVREMVHVEKAVVYGIGDCFGAWDEAMDAARFAVEGTTAKATLAKNGNIRMYAASSIANTAWWTREFVFSDGKIVYRGNGGELAAVPGTAGQVVTLDFAAGTAALQ